MIGFLLVGLVALLVVSMAFAPLEALSWWSSSKDIERRAAALVRHHVHAKAQPSAPTTERFVVYLAGIGSASGETIFPEEIPFLAYVTEHLPGMKVVQNVFPYSVINEGLTGQRTFAWLWRTIDQLRLDPRGGLVGYLINARNMLQLLVSADKRYGPVYNIGMARSIAYQLSTHGYPLGSGVPITVIGSSGGAQIALGAATYLHNVLNAPIHLVTLGGVMSGDIGINYVERLDELLGAHDPFPKLIAMLFPSRWPLGSTDWAHAVAQGRVQTTIIGPMKHHADGGYFDPNQHVPNGQSHLERSAEAVVEAILRLHTATVRENKPTPALRAVNE